VILDRGEAALRARVASALARWKKHPDVQQILDVYLEDLLTLLTEVDRLRPLEDQGDPDYDS